MSDGDIPGPEIREGRTPLARRISLVWLVPVLALAVSLGIAWQAYSNRGALIEITFQNGSGVVAGTTQVRFRDVTVGTVESVSFSPDLTRVIVQARMEKVVAPYLDSDASFWVVRPKVSVREVTGLNTVLGGVYIEGNWDREAGTPLASFTGEDAPPLVRADQPGRYFTLAARDGNRLSEGAPILHRGIPVGYIDKPELNAEGTGVTVRAFIEAPFDAQIAEATRFWDTSGFSVSLGPGGLTLNVTSIASLVEGGIGFDTLVSGSGPPAADRVFTIFSDEDTARQSLFSADETDDLQLSIVFAGSISGLVAGADVKLRGVRVGKVENVNAVIDTSGGDGNRRPTIKLLANISLSPGRLGMGTGSTPEDTLNFLAEYVERGLRARLTTGSILTGSLIVELVELPSALPARLDLEAKPYPVMPSVDADISDFSATAEGVLDRINKLPIEDLLSSTIALIDDIDAIVADEDTRKIPASTVALLDEAKALVGSDEVKAIPVAVSDAAADVRGIVGDLREAQAVEKLVKAIEQAGNAASALDTATEGLPELMASLEDLTRKANALEIEALIARATEVTASLDALVTDPQTKALPGNASALLEDARALIASEDVQAIPGEIRGTAEGFKGIATDIRAAQTVEKLTDTIAQAGAAIAKIDGAMEGLPEILAGIEALTAKANALEIETLVTSVTTLSQNLDALVSDEAVKALPGSANALLDDSRLLLASPDVQAIPGDIRALTADLRGVIEDLRAAQTIEKLAAAVDSAGAAAAKIDAASTDLPEIVAQVKALAEKANSLEVETFLAQATELSASLDALVGTDAARALPENLNASLEEIRALVAEIREGGAIENVNSALNSAKSAADAVETAAASLPELSDRINALVGRAETVLNSYGPGSKVNSEAVAMLRDIQAAADAVSALARAIQRNPNSLLIGR